MSGKPMTAFARGLARLRKAAEKKARTDRPERLNVFEIDVFPEVFQARIGDGGGSNGVRSEKHVEELASALSNMPADARALDAILVLTIGRRFVVVDGHHRLAAYHRAAVFASVPVEHFEGSLDDAIGEAARRNAKAHLPMTLTEKTEAAWRIVSLEAHSVAEQVRLGSVSRRTILRMRKLRREAGGTGFEGTYREALLASRDRGSGEFGAEERDTVVADLAEKLGRAIGPQGLFPPGTLMEAVKVWQGDHYVRRMVEAWNGADEGCEGGVEGGPGGASTMP